MRLSLPILIITPPDILPVYIYTTPEPMGKAEQQGIP